MITKMMKMFNKNLNLKFINYVKIINNNKFNVIKFLNN